MKLQLFKLRGNTFKEKAVSLKENLATKIAMGILRPFFRHKLIHQENILENPDNPLVLLGNHAEIYGPIASTLCLPIDVRFWVISMMMFDRKQVKKYLYENTFSKKKFLPVLLRRLISWFLGWLSVNVMNALRAIAVYRDSPMKLRQTLRESVEALENGENLMIFPEHPEGKYEKGGVSEFSAGFMMLAEAWWKKSKKMLRLLPVYANEKMRTFTFGEEIQYNPENGFAAEQIRILKEARDQMLRMAGVDEKEPVEA